MYGKKSVELIIKTGVASAQQTHEDLSLEMVKSLTALNDQNGKILDDASLLKVVSLLNNNTLFSLYEKFKFYARFMINKKQCLHVYKNYPLSYLAKCWM